MRTIVGASMHRLAEDTGNECTLLCSLPDGQMHFSLSDRGRKKSSDKTATANFCDDYDEAFYQRSRNSIYKKNYCVFINGL